MNIAEIWIDFSSSEGYSLDSSSHHQLSWYFLKCFFVHASSSIKPPDHFIFKIYFWSKEFFYDPLLSFCSSTSANLEKVLPGLFVCLCSPHSFSFLPKCTFEVVFMQIEQFNISLCLHYSVTHFLQFSTCLPDLVLDGTQNLSGKIVAQLCKMCPHDSPISFTLFFWVLLY